VMRGSSGSAGTTSTTASDARENETHTMLPPGAERPLLTLTARTCRIEDTSIRGLWDCHTRYAQGLLERPGTHRRVE
jgi:hypothetical protein